MKFGKALVARGDLIPCAPEGIGQLDRLRHAPRRDRPAPPSDRKHGLLSRSAVTPHIGVKEGLDLSNELFKRRGRFGEDSKGVKPGVHSRQRGDIGNAERLIKDAIATKPNVRLGHFNLALLAEQRGDIRTAEREYLEELKAHPEAYKAACVRAGQREGQFKLAVLQYLKDLAMSFDEYHR